MPVRRRAAWSRVGYRQTVTPRASLSQHAVSMRRALVATAGAPHRSGAHGGPLSWSGVTLDYVDVSAEALARVPGQNLQVSLAEFGPVWALAERFGSQPGPDDDYLIGVLRTCRWLADRPVPSVLPGRAAEMPRSPLGRRLERPMPETIESELLAAYIRPGPRRELARGVAATLEWAWRRKGRPPLDVRQAAAG
jgi:hypothetical protein